MWGQNTAPHKKRGIAKCVCTNITKEEYGYVPCHAESPPSSGCSRDRPGGTHVPPGFSSLAGSEAPSREFAEETAGQGTGRKGGEVDSPDKDGWNGA